MPLRSRIALTMVSVLAVLIGIAGVAWNLRESSVLQVSAERELEGHRILFLNTLDALFYTMEREIGVIAEDESIIGALEQESMGQVATLAETAVRRLKELQLVDYLEITDEEGQIAYSSQNELFPTPLLSASQYQRIVDTREPLVGVGSLRITGSVPAGRVGGRVRAAERSVADAVAFVGFPLSRRGQVLGVATYASDVSRSLGAIKRAISNDLFIVNRRGRVLAGTDPDLWNQIERATDLSDRQIFRTVRTYGPRGGSAIASTTGTGGSGGRNGEQVFNVGLLSLPSSLGDLAASLVVVRDLSEEYHANAVFSTWALGGFIGGLLLLVGWIFWYLRRELRPLAACVGALNTLSRGSVDTHSLEFGDRRDEIGQIARSIELLKRGIGGLERMRISRERQRLRRERFIRREMTGLAHTLDDESKESMLRDLEKIEAIGSSRTASQKGEGHDVFEEASSEDDSFQESSDTLRPMAIAFQNMSLKVREQQAKLQRVVSELQEALGDKDQFTSLQSELGIAQRIQLSMLPKEFPEHPYVEIRGFMRPAKEVGGDFYDFFHLDDDRVGVVIADVSGKGIPAALFMAISRTLQKSTAMLGEPPGACLGLLNNILAESNSEELFVTLFYGVYDITSGDLLYANAGHSPPVILRGREHVDRLETTDGLALAVWPDFEYEERSVTLERGDTVLLFTEGVTGATSTQSREFGYERLIKTLENTPRDSAAGMINKLVASIDSFAGGAPQSDDITCLVLRRKSESADSAYVDAGTI